MTIISLLITLFAGFLYLLICISEIEDKKKKAQMLQLNLPEITADIEQVIEKTATVTGKKLLFDSRYIRYVQSSSDYRAHLVSLPIMLSMKPGDEEESYIQQVFLTEFSKYLAESSTYENWSDKGKSLLVAPQFEKILRYNNQYYLNLEIYFSYNSN